MNMLDWNDDKMSLGIKLIDEQHKELINIINLLAHSITNNSQKEDILTIVDKLIDYSSYHFDVEEKLLAKFNYEEKDYHIKEHKGFTKKFSDLKVDIINDKYYTNKSPIDIAEEVFDFLTDWLLNHILHDDRKFVDLFKEKGFE